MKYKLIKLLPFENSPRIGYTSEPHLSQKDEDHYWNGLWFNPENYPEFWELVVEKDYEILSLSDKRNQFSILNLINGCSPITGILYPDINSHDWNIHSIKRLSDGEVFTIGDKVFSEYVNYTINKIGIVNDKCMVSALYDTNNSNGSRLHYNLNNLKKAKQPLFTTEDGVDIFKNIDKYYTPIYIVDKALNIRYCEKDFSVKPSENVKYFFNKEKAEEYILMNKPVLSLKDVASIYISADKPITDTTSFSAQNRRIQDLVKSKIQQSV